MVAQNLERFLEPGDDKVVLARRLVDRSLFADGLKVSVGILQDLVVREVIAFDQRGHLTTPKQFARRMPYASIMRRGQLPGFAPCGSESRLMRQRDA